MAHIREIFKLERDCKLMGPEQRAKERIKALTVPLACFKTWLDEQSTTTRSSSAMGKAITYARNQWATLVVFVTKGCVPVDNNASERQLRGPVVGRKNWMFAGSEGGAQTDATCFTIIGSCALVGINPYDYLRDVLRSRAIWPGLLPDATPSTLGTLTPRAWAERLGPKAP